VFLFVVDRKRRVTMLKWAYAVFIDFKCVPTSSIVHCKYVKLPLIKKED